MSIDRSRFRQSIAVEEMSIAQIVALLQMEKLTSNELRDVRHLLQDRLERIRKTIEECVQSNQLQLHGSQKQALHAASLELTFPIADPTDIDPSMSRVDSLKTRPRQIESAYALVAELSERRIQHPEDTVLLERFNEAFAELRQLQREEAAEIEQHSLMSLVLPLGKGARALAEANVVLARYANPPSTNSVAE